MKIIIAAFLLLYMQAPARAETEKKESRCAFNLSRMEKSVELQKKMGTTRKKVWETLTTSLSSMKAKKGASEDLINKMIALLENQTEQEKNGEEMTNLMSDLLKDSKETCR